MARFHPILDQVDGIKDTFELPEAFVLGSIVLAYNGQVFDKMMNITAEDNVSDPPTVTLSFVPALDTTNLMIIYTPTLDGAPGNGAGTGPKAYTYPPGGLLNDC